MQAIVNLIDQLSDAQNMQSLLQIQYNEHKIEIMQSIQKQLDALEAQRLELLAQVQPQLDALSSELGANIVAAEDKQNELRKQVEEAIQSYGQTVKGAHLMALYVKGRTTWDSQKLEGYAAAHPEIEKFKKTGNSSVSFRSI